MLDQQFLEIFFKIVSSKKYSTVFYDIVFRAEGALTIECQRTDYGPWICECAVSRFMELIECGNGVRAKRSGRPQALGSWDMYSIDGIRRGYARPMRNYRLEMELREASDTGFSDLTKMEQTR